MPLNLIIEVFQENESVIEKTFGNGNKGYSQIGYVNLGNKFPEQIKIPLQQGQSFYKSGKYELLLSSFRVGKYGDLEVNPFELNLVPAK